MLERLWRALVHTWEAWQVELHGKYSVQRICSLQQYSRRSSLSHALLIIFLTPLPCVLTIILIDVIPLEAPESGLAHSHAFWLRIYFTSLCMNFTILEQGRQYIPALPISGLQIVLLTIFVTTGGLALGIGWAYGIGYPLPFTPCFIASGCMLLLAVASTILWGKYVRGKPAIQTDILNYMNIVGASISLIFIYPAYNYVFMRLTSSQQTAFALLLPVMKILAKNGIAYLVRHLEDFRPEVVTFNVEIFHALFVAYCTRQSSTLHTTVVLMSMDFVQACASLWDVELLRRSLHELINSSTGPVENHPESQAAITTTTGRQVSPVASPPSDLCLLDAAMYILSIDRQLRSNPSLRLSSQAMSLRPQVIVIRHQESKYSSERAATFTLVDHNQHEIGRLGKMSCHRKNARVTVHPGAPRLRTASVELILDALANTTRISDDDKQRLQSLSLEARLQVVHQSLQLLHLTEFLLLVEFTEVIVPCIYCIFVRVVSQLPNRQYYTNLRDLDDAALWNNIMKVMAYAGLEVVSFVMLAALLSRRLRMSPFKQLTFVLESQWQLVQSKLMLWVLFSLQTTLVHIGIDYSFQFVWLHKSV